MREIFAGTADDVIEGEKTWGKNSPAKHGSRLNNLLSHWDEILKIMDEELPETEALIKTMRDIGIPTTPADLGLDDAATRRAFIGSREIRDKYILSSMLWDLGLLKHPDFLIW